MHTNQPVPSMGNLSTGTNNPAGTIFPSAIRTAATYTSEEMQNLNWKGVRLYINRTVATGTIVVSIEGRDPVTDTWEPLKAGFTPSQTTAVLSTLTVYPGILAAAGADTTSTEVSDFLPCAWRVKVVVSTDTTTWSIGGEYLL